MPLGYPLDRAKPLTLLPRAGLGAGRWQSRAETAWFGQSVHSFRLKPSSDSDRNRPAGLVWQPRKLAQEPSAPDLRMRLTTKACPHRPIGPIPPGEMPAPRIGIEGDLWKRTNYTHWFSFLLFSWEGLDMGSRLMRLILAKVNVDRSLWVHSTSEAMKKLQAYLLGQNNRPFNVVHRKREEYWALSRAGQYPTQSGRKGETVLAGTLGRLVRAKTTGFDPATGFTEDQVEDWELCNFILDQETEALLFEERPAISRLQFTEGFARLCSLAPDELGYVDVGLRIDREQLAERLRRVRTLYSARFVFRLPNPRVGGHYEDIVRDLLENGAQNGERLYSSPTGLNLQGPSIQAGIDMSADGYAKYEFKVEDDSDVIRTVSSSSDCVGASVESSDDPAEFAARFYLTLRKLQGKRNEE
jgi:hypothetical protein